MNTPPNIAVIIAAGGVGTRMGSDRPKQLLELAGAPLLLYTLRPFLEHPDIAEVVIACRPDDREEIQALCNRAFPPQQIARLRVTDGGRRRQDSVANGLRAASAPLALVHDAARPMVSADLIGRCCDALREGRALVTAIPVVDTVKQVSEGVVSATLDRSTLFRAQTPQGALTALLLEAFDRFSDEDHTDESSLLERAGVPVHVIPGEENNFKVTLQEDLARAAELLQQRPLALQGAAPQPSPAAFARIGHGFDAHRFTENRDLVLGGVHVPYHLGLAGHSDADVVTHALCDALLGAAGLGDIGKAFPDNDPQYKGINSLLLLERVLQMIAPWRIENIDISILCQAPKLAPHLAQMCTNLAITPAAFAGDPATAINIKATTEEKMGYTGRGEGISCHAVVLLVPSPHSPVHP